MSLHDYLEAFNEMTIDLMDDLEQVLQSAKIKYDRTSDGEIIIHKTKKINMDATLKKLSKFEKDYELDKVYRALDIKDMDEKIVIRLKFIGNN